MTKLPRFLLVIIFLLSVGTMACGSSGSDPDVDSTTPRHGETGIDLLVPLSLTFEEDITLVNPESIFISGGATGVSASLEADNRTITITHDPFLEANEYWWGIPEGYVWDVDENPNDPYNWSFTTSEVGPPYGDVTIPSDGETGIDLLAPLSITFDEDITLVDPAGIFISGGANGVSASLEANNRTITITHDPFLESNEYWWGIPEGSVQDIDGNTNSSYTWSFTTIEVGVPSIESAIPSDGETGIDLLAPLSITFDEDIDLVNPEGIFISGGATGISASLEADNRTITITHDPFLEANEYWWGIPEGSVQDIDGNTNSSYTWSFTTIEVGAPDVDGTTPSDGGTDIDLLAPLSITFDEDITLVNPEGVFIGGGATGISASLEADNRTVSITHDPFLEANEYWWGIPEGSIQDIDGNTNFSYTWSFTTIEVGAPDVESTTPGNAESGIDLLAPLSITFDEDITMVNSGDIFISGGATGVSASLEDDNRTITITHDPFLETNEYWWGIPEGSIRDIDGNANPSYTWSFTTMEVGVPSVESTTPGNAETGIDLRAPLSITFDEDITLVDPEGVFISGGATGVSVSVEADNRTITITHDPFLGDNEYWWGIPEGYVLDADENPNSLYNWSFTTQ